MLPIFFTDKDAIYKQMEGKSPEERKALVEAYNQAYGKGPEGQNFDDTLKQNMSGLDLDKAKQLESQGKLDDTFALQYAMHGSWWSTDKDAIKSTLAGKSKADVDALCAKYKSQYGIDLQAELSDETSGRAGFEINQLMKGEPKTPEEKIARANESYDFERGGGFSSGFMDVFSDKGKILDMQHGRIQELAEKAKHGELSAEDKARLDQLTGYQKMDVKTYQETKDTAANTAATAAAVVVGTAVTILSGGAAAPAEVALLSALAGGGASIATKIAIQGQGYSNEDLRNDLVMTGVSAATGGLMANLGGAGGALSNFAKGVTSSEVGQQMIVQGVSGAVTSSVSNMTSTAMDPATWHGSNPLGTLAKVGGMGLLTGTVGGVTTAGASGLIGNGEGAAFNTWKGAASSTAGAVASNLVNPAMYNGDSGALVNQWVSSVGGAAVNGGGAGYQSHLQQQYEKANTPAPAQQGTEAAPATKPANPTEGTPVAATPSEPAAATAASGPTEVAPAHAQGPISAPEAAAAAPAAKVIETLPTETAANITKALPPEAAAPMTQALPAETAAKVIAAMPPEAAAPIQEQLPPKAAAHVQSELPAEQVAPILEHVAPETAAQLQESLPPAKEAQVIEQTPPEKQGPIFEAQAEAPAATKVKPAARSDKEALNQLFDDVHSPEDLTTLKGWEQEQKQTEQKALRDLVAETRANKSVHAGDLRSLQEMAQEFDVSTLMRPEHALTAPGRGLNDGEMGLYHDSLNRDQQSTMQPEHLLPKDSAGAPISTPEELAKAQKTLEAAQLSTGGGTETRQAPTQEHLAALLKANELLHQDVQPGELMRKVITESGLAEFLTGEKIASWLGPKGADGKAIGGVLPANTIGGDIGLARNTEGMGAAEMVRHLGLDYEKKPSLNPGMTETPEQYGNYTHLENGQTAINQQLLDRGVFHLDQPLTPEIVAAAKIPMGKDLHDYAIAQNSPLVDGDRIAPRPRLHQDDPSAGFGYTASQGLRGENGEQFFTPNQELNLGRGKDQKLATQADLKVTNAEGQTVTIASRDSTGQFVLNPDLPPAELAYYQNLMQTHRAKIAELRARTAAMTDPAPTPAGP